MIPRTLQLKNFVSYSSQTINFEPYHLICLSGKNGHGKSALLDAITWALWGQARKVSGAAKADEGLVRLGQNHMMVTLDFSAGGVLYRVRREYTVVGTKATAGLEFGIVEPETGALRALTDKTIRITQDKITQLIGLDYESFINSAFLRQGQSQEFSKKTPKERKEILGTILGLDRFEILRRAALDKVKEIHNLRELSIVTIDRLKAELANQASIKEQLDEINRQLNGCVAKETELRNQLALLAGQSNLIAQQKAQAEQVSFQKEHLEKTIAAEKDQILKESSIWRRITIEQRHQRDYASIEKEQQALQKELQEIQIIAARKIQLKEEWLAKKEAARTCLTNIQAQSKEALENAQLAKQRWDLECKAAQEKFNELTKKMESINTERMHLRTERDKVAPLLAVNVEEEREKLNKAEALFERRKAAYHTFVSKAQTITHNRAALAQKLELIENTEQAQCPLCEQNADKKHLHKKFTAHENLYKHQLSRLQKVTTELKASLVREHAALENMKKRAEDLRIAHIKEQEWAKQNARILADLEASTHQQEQILKQIEVLIHQKEKAEQAIATHQKELATAQEQEIYANIMREVSQLETTLEKIPYSPQRETVIHESMAKLSQQLSQRTALIAESTRQEERKKLVHQKCQLVIELKKQLLFLTKSLETLNSYKSAQAALKEQEDAHTAAFSVVTKEKEHHIHQKGALEAQAAALKLKELEVLTEEKALAAHTHHADEYTAIAAAMGKDGIQALLIEEVIPEIESEANDLLGRLTENQAHLSIESLRDLKSGKAKETLDIKISDAVGVRPYELFSGGEAFRIDFALRIAISKLLARRSGTALQTLIIDEGFGSQDEDGLNNIMEALYTIQDDFAKIIIVSHLPSMKEQFPVHFLVTKGSDGSSVQVIEHC